MTRVLLINPPSPERLGTPLLGLQYVAASALAAGAEVRVIDAAARFHDPTPEDILAEAERFDPDIVGFSLFSRWVLQGYRLAERMQGRFPMLVAGGAHATVRPDETLAQGFDIAVTGEAEHTIRHLIAVREGSKALDEVPGIRFRDDTGRIHTTPSAGFIDDLDALPPPVEAQHLFDPDWYDQTGAEVIPGGLLTSRGCPARCTFCANYVTGRGFRYRSGENVAAELNAWHARSGATFFPCWDDALTAHKKRVFELCDTLQRDVAFDLKWSAITRANQVTPEMLRAMKDAGLVAVNFGVESGDDDILRQIKKGVTTDQVVRGLEWAKEEGLVTAANFMVGFPDDTPETLENTLRFLERIAPLVDSFSTLGVLVPFPGTPLYEDYHEQYGFTDWWLEERCFNYDAAPPTEDFDRFYRHYIDDANLGLDFFRYDTPTRDMTRDVLRYKAEHNLVRMGLMTDPVHRPEPVEAAIEPVPA